MKQRTPEEEKELVDNIKKEKEKHPDKSWREIFEQFKINGRIFYYLQAKLAGKPQDRNRKKPVAVSPKGEIGRPKGTKNKKTTPQLVTIPVDEKRKEVKILIGDSDAIAQIMTRLGY